MKIRFTLSIGFAGADHAEELDVDDADVPSDPTEREAYLTAEWKEWAWNYIDGGATVIDDPTPEPKKKKKRK